MTQRREFVEFFPPAILGHPPTPGDVACLRTDVDVPGLDDAVIVFLDDDFAILEMARRRYVVVPANVLGEAVDNADHLRLAVGQIVRRGAIRPSSRLRRVSIKTFIGSSL